MPLTEPLRVLAARADLCRLLAACYYEPGEEFAEERLFDALQAAADVVDGALGEPARALAEAFADTPLQALRIDYTRLFIGPQRPLAPPYGSVWLENATTLVQPSTLAVEQLYAEAGFELDESFRDLPDHVAAELEFLYVLVYGEAHAEQAGDADGVARQRRWQRQLLSQHIDRWSPAFCDALARAAETAFYRALAALTRGVLAREAARTGA